MELERKRNNKVVETGRLGPIALQTFGELVELFAGLGVPVGVVGGHGLEVFVCVPQSRTDAILNFEGGFGGHPSQFLHPVASPNQVGVEAVVN